MSDSTNIISSAEEQYILQPRKQFRNYGYQLSESQIRYACANTSSNREAAGWLHITEPTWKKYATKYIDEETQLSLYELQKKKYETLIGTNHKKQNRKRKPLSQLSENQKKFFKELTPMEEIIRNEHLKYPLLRFKFRLIKELYKVERCDICGYQEQRKSDLEVPLRLIQLDGNKKNYALENQALICFNCCFIHGLNQSKPKQFKLHEVTGEIVPKAKLFAWSEQQAEENKAKLHCESSKIHVEDR